MIILGNIDVKQLLLELAQLHSVEAVLLQVVNTLASASDAALVRIWLIGAGDICGSCQDADLCPDKMQCLHLSASAGQSAVHNVVRWDTVEHSGFSRFPLGVRKVGTIAQSGMPLEVPNIIGDELWIANPDWIREEGVCSFAGQPLICRGKTLGVLAVFARKPFANGELALLRMVADHIAYAIANAQAFETIEGLRRQKEVENAFLREEIREVRQFKGIIGISPQIEEIRRRIGMVGPTDANVLIEGASGTGKEMVAHEIHQHSSRRDKAMIKINCAAIPKDLFESEFFGHVKGAFTGAVRDRIGYFQAADGGTLFLDEVGEIPIELQGKLLRTLQEGEYRRVGEERVFKGNIRLIAATNRDLRQAIQVGTFREDLYYRLQVFPLRMPLLKERPEDIPLLAEHFALLICQKLNRPVFRFSDEQVQILMGYDWPGNIRELHNLIERVTITGQAAPLLSELTLARPAAREQEKGYPAPSLPSQVLTESQLRNLEKENMLLALRRTNWLIYGPRGAARLLDIKPTTLISRLRRLGIYDKRLPEGEKE